MHTMLVHRLKIRKTGYVDGGQHSHDRGIEIVVFPTVRIGISYDNAQKNSLVRTMV